ncbi:MAG: hypothetical protein RSB82_05050 [Victivallaceae bacterium]
MKQITWSDFKEMIPFIDGILLSTQRFFDEKTNIIYKTEEEKKQAKLKAYEQARYRVFSCLILAQELGLSLFSVALGQVYILKGNLVASPSLINTLIHKAGHKLEVTERTVEKCKIKCTRKDTGAVHTVEFTKADAITAGLWGKEGAWKKYPEAMLYNRCLSKLGRQGFSDVFAVPVYVPGELNDDDESVPVSEVSLNAITMSEESVYDYKPACGRKEVVEEIVFHAEEEPQRQEVRERTFVPIPDDMKISNILFSPFAQRRREENARSKQQV